jgi:hypothetical protein
MQRPALVVCAAPLLVILRRIKDVEAHIGCAGPCDSDASRFCRDQSSGRDHHFQKRRVAHEASEATSKLTTQGHPKAYHFGSRALKVS